MARKMSVHMQYKCNIFDLRLAESVGAKPLDNRRLTVPYCFICHLPSEKGSSRKARSCFVHHIPC
jgi:hypothetical protein